MFRLPTCTWTARFWRKESFELSSSCNGPLILRRLTPPRWIDICWTWALSSKRCRGVTSSGQSTWRWTTIMGFLFAASVSCVVSLALLYKKFSILSFTISSWPGLYSSDVFMIICSASMFISSFFGTLVVCFFVCGKLHETVSKLYQYYWFDSNDSMSYSWRVTMTISLLLKWDQMRSLYGPLANLIANKNFKLSTSIKIERLLEFIGSEHAGFRCGSVFLIRTDITMEVFFSIIINTILLYSMIFFLFSQSSFYVPTWLPINDW